VEGDVNHNQKRRLGELPQGEQPSTMSLFSLNLANVIVDQKVDSMINQFEPRDPHSPVPVTDRKRKKRWWKEM
jgi:hypothetical protein